MEIITYLIPFVTVIVLLSFFRKETAWWEYLLVIIPSLLLALAVEACMKYDNVIDTEYLGYYVTKIRYEEPWNEYIHKTCTETRVVGHDKNGRAITQTYTRDCSYVEEHHERWLYTLNNGDTEYFYNEDEFNKVKHRLSVQPQFIDMHRHYHTKDGDAYEWHYDNTEQHCYPMTFTHKYENYVKNSHSVFKYKEITDDEADSLGLYKYPKIVDYDQNPIIGMNLGEAAKRKIQYINGTFGRTHQVRLFILIWKNKSAEQSQLQRAYWQGGNKNECVVCLGVDSHNKVTWADAWSWEDTPNISVKSKSFFLHNGGRLDIQGFANMFIKEIKQGHWKRKEFKDYSYISIDLTDGQLTALFIIVLLYNIGISIWVILNEYKLDSPDGGGRFNSSSRRHNRYYHKHKRLYIN